MRRQGDQVATGGYTWPIFISTPARPGAATATPTSLLGGAGFVKTLLAASQKGGRRRDATALVLPMVTTPFGGEFAGGTAGHGVLGRRTGRCAGTK